MSAMSAARGPLPGAYQLLRSKETPRNNTTGQSRTPSPVSNEQQRDSLLSPPLRRYSEAPSDFQGGRRKEGPHERVDNVQGSLSLVTSKLSRYSYSDFRSELYALSEPAALPSEIATTD
jgi:hypothetical protein